LRKTGASFVSLEDGRACAQKIGALKYLECSAMTAEGLKGETCLFFLPLSHLLFFSKKSFVRLYVSQSLMILKFTVFENSWIEAFDMKHG
jgi:hypothetical protein